jgi:hypothetical protein
MAQWGNTDTTANSVLWGVKQARRTANATNRDAFYQNTTVGAWTNAGVPSRKAMGQFGVSVAEIANSSGEGSKVAHTGWNIRTVGTGPVVSVNVVAGGAGYNNTDVVRIATGGTTTGTTNATASLRTNPSGTILSVTITDGGVGYVNTTRANSAFAISNSTGGATGGAAANLVAIVGGRVGRVQYETLVAFGMSNNATTDDSILPQA